ncbi:hypothetical protein [Bifidobacterium biavatii]|uniref:Uncharacterized protein n=1 Tax=Bifidobacterium biavatii DSM 23969 TaxID=1437608 RepID=A0A086ZU40_9BIFI|nr:hypothetical protein [Bifidobacterium biavatii]KFI50040.1 hypothetical protein BBIA_2173 [Bifidobacterium biavatii DSM 23969]
MTRRLMVGVFLIGLSVGTLLGATITHDLHADKPQPVYECPTVKTEGQP